MSVNVSLSVVNDLITYVKTPFNSQPAAGLYVTSRGQTDSDLLVEEDYTQFAEWNGNKATTKCVYAHGDVSLIPHDSNFHF